MTNPNQLKPDLLCIAASGFSRGPRLLACGAPIVALQVEHVMRAVLLYDLKRLLISSAYKYDVLFFVSYESICVRVESSQNKERF